MPTSSMPNQDTSPAQSASTDASQRFERMKRFLQQDPDNIGLRSQAVAAAIQAGSWEEAEGLLQDGFARAPQAAELHAHAGFVALHRLAYEPAKQHFSAALNAGMTADAVRYNLAFSHFQLGEYQLALDALEAIAAEPGLVSEKALLSARCLHHLGEQERAITILQQLAQRNDEAEGLLALLLHEVDRNEEALAAAGRALSGSPSQLEALLARAATLAELEQFDDARKDYEVATTVHPHCGRAWSGLAQLDFRDFQFAPALDSLQKAVKHMPNHIGTWHMLAWLHVLQGNVADAKHAFERSYEIDRNFGETHGGLAVIAVMEDQIKLAEEYIKRALRLNPHGFAAQYAKMLLLEKQGKPNEAKTLFTTVMQTANPGIGIAPEVLVNKRLQELRKKAE